MMIIYRVNIKSNQHTLKGNLDTEIERKMFHVLH